mgnify:CR=1 FL=1
MKRHSGLALALAATLATALAVMRDIAAAQGSDRAGRAIAGRWCVECHLIAPDGPGSDIGPTFESVANDPQRTDGRLRGWLADPHPPMPNLDLTRREIEDVIAYLQSLTAP